MKFRIVFTDGRWNVIEPGGEVVWHFHTLVEAHKCVNTLAASKASKRDAQQSAGGGE